MTAVYAVDMSVGDLGVLIAALTVSVTTIIGAVFAGLAAIRSGRAVAGVAQVQTEVKTLNGLALGQLADAAETRRIEAKPAADVTAAEAEHVALIPLPPENV